MYSSVHLSTHHKSIQCTFRSPRKASKHNFKKGSDRISYIDHRLGMVCIAMVMSLSAQSLAYNADDATRKKIK